MEANLLYNPMSVCWDYYWVSLLSTVSPAYALIQCKSITKLLDKRNCRLLLSSWVYGLSLDARYHRVGLTCKTQQTGMNE